MKKLLFVTMLGLLTQNIYAGCEQAYVEKIKVLEGRMNPARSVAIANTAGMIISQAIIFGATGAITVAGAVALPAVAAGAGGYYAVLLVERARLRAANHFIRDAKRGQGKDLENLVERINKRNNSNLSLEEVAKVIVDANNKNEFCEVNDHTDRAKLLKPNKFMKFIEAEFALNQ